MHAILSTFIPSPLFIPASQLHGRHKDHPPVPASHSTRTPPPLTRLTNCRTLPVADSSSAPGKSKPNPHNHTTLNNLYKFNHLVEGFSEDLYKFVGMYLATGDQKLEALYVVRYCLMNPIVHVASHHFPRAALKYYVSYSLNTESPTLSWGIYVQLNNTKEAPCVPILDLNFVPK